MEIELVIGFIIGFIIPISIIYIFSIWQKIRRFERKLDQESYLRREGDKEVYKQLNDKLKIYFKKIEEIKGNE